ncbi:hypothetical protein RCL_jg7704.t1 [Rhizophagus clarus]|uniref:Uncharacterized protein n=1 Tax=Rhizophagus clarus TaxID=94130 RepID=A0A8H3MCN4_9GLOM|nr:hypothetical protein RCL_jg7704.t1 [Rhizophagus clarus]
MITNGIMKRFDILKNKLGKIVYLFHKKINKISLTEKNWHELIKEYNDKLKTIEEGLEKPLELSANKKFQFQLNILNYVTEVGFENLSNKLDLLKDDKFYFDEGLSEETNQKLKKSIHKKKAS